MSGKRILVQLGADQLVESLEAQAQIRGAGAKEDPGSRSDA